MRRAARRGGFLQQASVANQLAVSPDGKALAIDYLGGWPGDGEGFRLWDLTTAKPIGPFHPIADVKQVSFMDQGARYWWQRLAPPGCTSSIGKPAGLRLPPCPPVTLSRTFGARTLPHAPRTRCSPSDRVPGPSSNGTPPPEARWASRWCIRARCGGCSTVRTAGCWPRFAPTTASVCGTARPACRWDRPSCTSRRCGRCASRRSPKPKRAGVRRITWSPPAPRATFTTGPCRRLFQMIPSG